eukprot:jgi/Ulvmu1/12890/UM098_0078.1
MTRIVWSAMHVQNQVNDSFSDDEADSQNMGRSAHGLGSCDSAERRLLDDVKLADAKLKGLKGCPRNAAENAAFPQQQPDQPDVQHNAQYMHAHPENFGIKHSAPPRQASAASSAAELSSLPSSQGQPNSPKVSSIVKRVVEATGHGLEQLLGQEHAVGPVPVWTTSSHAVRPISSCVLETYRRSYKDVQLCLTFSSPDYTPALVIVHHSQSPTADFRVLGVADVQKTSEACTHVIGFPEHKQQLLRFVRIQLRYCHGPRLHGVCKHEVSALSLQGTPTVRRSVHNVSRRLRRRGIQVKSALRTPQSPRVRRKRKSVRPRRDETSPEELKAFEAPGERWGMAQAAPGILCRDGQAGVQEHLAVGDHTPECKHGVRGKQTPPMLCPHTCAFHTPASGFGSSDGMGAATALEGTPKYTQAVPPPPPLPAPTYPPGTGTHRIRCAAVTEAACKAAEIEISMPNKHRGAAPPPPAPPLPQKAQAAKPMSRPQPPPHPPLLPGATSSGGPAPPPPPPPPPGRRGSKSLAQRSDMPDQAVEQTIESGPAPTKKTVRLFWKKMANPTQAEQPTVWSDVAALPVQIDFAELEEQFAAKSATNKPVQQSPSKSNAHGPAASVLDMDRARNVGVLMRSLKMDTPTIQAALYASLSNCSSDQRRLEEFEIEGILAAFPSKAEAQQLQSLGDRRPTKEEHFLLQLLASPTLQQMLVAAKHMRTATAAVDSVRADVRTIAQACSDIHSSETLRKVLRYTLDMGNFLNTGSKDACAAAFHVEDLLKLKEVKGSGGTGGCKSLLHFLAKQLLQERQAAAARNTDTTPPRAGMDASATISAIRDELAACGPASKMDVSATNKSIADASNSLSQLKELMKGFQSSESDFKAGVVELLSKSVNDIEEEVHALRRSWSKQMESFSQLVAYLKGLKPSTTPAELFQLIHSFLKHLEAAMSDVAEVERRAARAAASPAFTARSPFTSPGLECSPMQVKQGVVKQMQAFCRLTPDARRECLTTAGTQRRLISESITGAGNLSRPTSSTELSACTLRSRKTPSMAVKAKLRSSGITPRGSRMTPRGRSNPQIWGFQGFHASRHSGRAAPAKAPAISSGDVQKSSSVSASVEQNKKLVMPDSESKQNGPQARAGRHCDLLEDRPLNSMHNTDYSTRPGGATMGPADNVACCSGVKLVEAVTSSPLRHRPLGFKPGGEHRYDDNMSLTSASAFPSETLDSVDSCRLTPPKPARGGMPHTSPLAAMVRHTPCVRPSELVDHGSPSVLRQPGSLAEVRDRPLTSLAGERRCKAGGPLPVHLSSARPQATTPASATGSCNTPSPDRLNELRELRMMRQVSERQSAVGLKAGSTPSKVLTYGSSGPAHALPTTKKSARRTQDILARARQAVEDDIGY